MLENGSSHGWQLSACYICGEGSPVVTWAHTLGTGMEGEMVLLTLVKAHTLFERKTTTLEVTAQNGIKNLDTWVFLSLAGLGPCCVSLL